MEMKLRRSARLSIKLWPRYNEEYTNIKTQLQEITTQVLNRMINYMRESYKVNVIINSTELMTKKIRFIMTYERKFNFNKLFETFCDMLYKKSFDWIEQTTLMVNQGYIELLLLTKLKNVFKKFRKIYESIRYAAWEFIRSDYNLDDNIMYCINSYLHGYNK